MLLLIASQVGKVCKQVPKYGAEYQRSVQRRAIVPRQPPFKCAGDRDTNYEHFSPVSELLPEGSSTEEVLQAAAEAALAEGTRDVVPNKHATKEGYISQVPLLSRCSAKLAPSAICFFEEHCHCIECVAISLQLSVGRSTSVLVLDFYCILQRSCLARIYKVGSPIINFPMLCFFP